MKIKPNLFPLAIVSWIMIVYLLATGNLAWYLWLYVAFVIVERLYVAFALWMQAQVISTMAKDIVSQLQKDGGPHGLA